MIFYYDNIYVYINIFIIRVKYNNKYILQVFGGRGGVSYKIKITSLNNICILIETISIDRLLYIKKSVSAQI